MAVDALAAFERLGRSRIGRWLYAQMVCWRAPYFGSIRPTVLDLRPGLCIARMTQRRALQNHIGTVHAIAVCNLAELTAGLVTEATLPKSMRWLPKRMQVDYLRKARGTLTATAKLAAPRLDEAQDGVVEVTVRDQADEVVVSATITMWLTPRPLGDTAHL